MADRKVAEINVREDDRMVKKSALHVMRYLLSFISSLILMTCAGYYIFFFDWNVTVMGKVINGVLIIVSVIVSLGFFWAAEKIREIY
ncbi:hypothetical protein [Pantoea agglomerans]|uniref:hypothetical protein n=1 Tax=Enterobacter agglomerans TaxID=549 RepID=UPI0028984699|nr:hypothetical protein [Pantoea agglomerans]WNK39790.1 hypothetical protein RM160_18670 [Pantoea agglomerans]